MKTKVHHWILIGIFLLIVFGTAVGCCFHASPILSQFMYLTGNMQVIFRQTPLVAMETIAQSAEVAVNTEVAFKQQYINVYGLTKRGMGNDCIDFTYRMSDGQCLPIPTKAVEACLKLYAQNTDQLVRASQENNTHFLWVMVPGKADEQDPVWQRYDLKNYYKDNEAIFLHELETYGISYLSMADYFEKKGMGINDTFLKTDHHWTTQAAFMTYQAIMAHVEENEIFSFDRTKTDDQSFRKIFFPQALVGTYGKNLGYWYTGKDDYTLFVPDFPTQYTVCRLNHFQKTEDKQGTFEEAVLTNTPEKLKKQATISYSNYVSNDFPRIDIENKLAAEGNILVIQDSFGSPVSAFLSTVCRHVTVIDPRSYRAQKLVDIIENESYDLVVELCSQMSLTIYGDLYFQYK